MPTQVILKKACYAVTPEIKDFDCYKPTNKVQDNS
jgi:hypothetical protein